MSHFKLVREGGVELLVERFYKLDSNGRLVLPRECTIAPLSYVRVFWDTERRALVIKKAEKDDPHVLRIDSKRRIFVPTWVRSKVEGELLIINEEDEGLIVTRCP